MSRLTEIVGRAEDDRSVFLFFCRKISNTKEKKIIGAMEKKVQREKKYLLWPNVKTSFPQKKPVSRRWVWNERKNESNQVKKNVKYQKGYTQKSFVWLGPV